MAEGTYIRTSQAVVQVTIAVENYPAVASNYIDHLAEIKEVFKLTLRRNPDQTILRVEIRNLISVFFRNLARALEEVLQRIVQLLVCLFMLIFIYLFIFFF